MVRKLMSLLMCAVLMFTMTGTAFADVANTADDKLAAVEVTLYGTAQTGPLADRIAKLEKDFEGVHTEGSMMDRINALYDAASLVFIQTAGLQFLLQYAGNSE